MVANPRECPECRAKTLYADYNYSANVTIYDCESCDFSCRGNNELNEVIKASDNNACWDENGVINSE